MLKLVSNVRQLFAADDFSRRHFSDAFFLGALIEFSTKGREFESTSVFSLFFLPLFDSF